LDLNKAEISDIILEFGCNNNNNEYSSPQIKVDDKNHN
jgi:hypothetical protein